MRRRLPPLHIDPSLSTPSVDDPELVGIFKFVIASLYSGRRIASDTAVSNALQSTNTGILVAPFVLLTLRGSAVADRVWGLGGAPEGARRMDVAHPDGPYASAVVPEHIAGDPSVRRALAQINERSV